MANATITELEQLAHDLAPAAVETKNIIDRMMTTEAALRLLIAVRLVEGEGRKR